MRRSTLFNDSSSPELTSKMCNGDLNKNGIRESYFMLRFCFDLLCCCHLRNPFIISQKIGTEGSHQNVGSRKSGRECFFAQHSLKNYVS